MTEKIKNDKEKDKDKDKDKDKEKKKSNSQNLKITEWRYSEFLGEKIPLQNFKIYPENQLFLVTNCSFSNNGEFVVVSDKGGRIIIFRKKDKTNSTKLEYFYEFQAHDKDFDMHKSIEYNEEVKALSIFPITDSKRIDIISASYRNIHIDRVYQTKTKIFEKVDKKSTDLPKLKETRNDVKCKPLLKFNNVHTSEINSVSISPINIENFISSDEENVYIWDVNHQKEVFNVISNNIEDENSEKITTSKLSPVNPSIFAYGTSKGVLNYCDLRINSKPDSFSQKFKDLKSSYGSTVFANQLLAVHDINFKLSNSYLMATRHYLSVNLWDERKNTEPVYKYLLYEPIINKLTYLYQNDFLKDRFTLSSQTNGNFILTGGYNNMFHVLDIEQRLNSQILLDSTNEKSLNTNIIRKVNSKGSCYYRSEEPEMNNQSFEKKITNVALSPTENFAVLACLNCIYTYNGSLATNNK